MPEPEKDFGYFMERFNELADEANSCGLSTVILIEDNNPIARKSSVSRITRGSPVTTVGLLHMALMEIARG